MRTLVLCVVLALTNSIFSMDSKIVEKLLNASVLVDSNSSNGSGVVIVRKVDGKNTAFVWTANHVLEREVKIKHNYFRNGRKISTVEVEAVPIKIDVGEDLALLKLERCLFDEGVEFATETPHVGQDICHVGSLFGESGIQSFTKGTVSFLDRKVTPPFSGEVLMDAIQVGACPGSSGGGIFSTDGKYVGMLLGGKNTSINHMKATRNIRKWAKDIGMEWAVDEKAKMISEIELSKLKVEIPEKPKQIIIKVGP